MKIDFIFSEIMCLKHIDLLLNLFDNLLYRIFIGPSRNSIFMSKTRRSRNCWC